MIMETNVKTSSVMSVKDWIITFLIMCIPIVNIVMLFIWALSDDSTNENKKNWAKASLLMVVIGFIFAMLVYGFIAMIGIALFKGM